jgi:hypothetical protein
LFASFGHVVPSKFGSMSRYVVVIRGHWWLRNARTVRPAMRARHVRERRGHFSPPPQLSPKTSAVDPATAKIAGISLADTALIAIGFGTIASRSTLNLSGAIYHASERLRAKLFAIAGNLLECRPTNLELRGGKVVVVGVPGMEVMLASVAQAARPGWDHRRPQGVDAGLEEVFYWEPLRLRGPTLLILPWLRWT